MKVAKIKKQKNNKKEVIDERYSLKSMLSIILVVLIAFILFYFITYFVIKRDDVKTFDNKNTEIDGTKITFNNLLNRKESEYYVLVYKSNVESNETNFKTLYDNYINNYKQNAESIPFYYVDMDDAFNNSHINDEFIISANVEEIKIKDEILFKINNGKIEKWYEGKDQILDKLSRL